MTDEAIAAAGERIRADAVRPERVSLSTDLFESMMAVIEQLPLGQVRELDAAVRSDVRPVGDDG